MLHGTRKLYNGLCLAAVLAPITLVTFPARAAVDAATIERLVGAKGRINEDEGVYKVSFPRDDVKVTVDGVSMPPFMGLTSWASFHARPGRAMVMGDIVLFQDEVGAAMDAALAGGLDVTGLHNHFFYDEPRVFFMHVGGEGTEEELAKGVRGVLDAVKKVRAQSPQIGKGFGAPGGPSAPSRRPPPAKSSITAAPLAAALGSAGGSPAEKEGMAKFTIGRTATMPCGCDVGKEMGVNTWAAFYGTDDNAFVDGDFATVEGELQPVLVALRKAGIHVVAIHNHMEGETPKYIFLHYWGTGAAADLAKGVKAALDAQKAAGKK